MSNFRCHKIAWTSTESEKKVVQEMFDCTRSPSVDCVYCKIVHIQLINNSAIKQQATTRYLYRCDDVFSTCKNIYLEFVLEKLQFLLLIQTNLKWTLLISMKLFAEFARSNNINLPRTINLTRLLLMLLLLLLLLIFFRIFHSKSCLTTFNWCNKLCEWANDFFRIQWHTYSTLISISTMKNNIYKSVEHLDQKRQFVKVNRWKLTVLVSVLYFKL